jgi:hypothetical protein
MKKGELQFSTVVYAILALLVLAVVIGIFFFLSKNPIEGLFNIGENAHDQGDDAIIKINNILGGCDPAVEDEPKCMFGKSVECGTDNKWEIVGECKDDE